MEKKYLDDRNILFVKLNEQEPCLYEKRRPDYSMRDKTDLASCRIAQGMKEGKGGIRGVNPVSPPLVILVPPPPPHQGTTGSILGGIAYHEIKLLNGDTLLREITE
jgi:hypothetical protein